MGVNEIIQVGNNIKRIRKEKGLTQEIMAKSLKIQRSTYSNYENNIREPKKIMLEGIASVLGVCVHQLLEIPSNEESIESQKSEMYKTMEHVEKALWAMCKEKDYSERCKDCNVLELCSTLSQARNIIIDKITRKEI